MPQYWKLDTQDKLDAFVEHVRQQWVIGKKPTVELVTAPGTRTEAQNAALHLWLRQVAEFLNDAGYPVMKVLRHDAEIPWTEHNAKELLWRPVQEAMTGKESTTACNKLEYSDIEQVISRHIAERIGLTLPPWPTRHGE